MILAFLGRQLPYDGQFVNCSKLLGSHIYHRGTELVRDIRVTWCVRGILPWLGSDFLDYFSYSKAAGGLGLN